MSFKEGMELYGSFTGTINSKDFTGPIFGGKERILFLDVEGVLLDQVSTMKNGRRGKDSYKINREACEIIRRAPRDHFDRVVLWTATLGSIGRLLKKEKLFAKADLFIEGGVYRDGELIKPIDFFTSRIENAVALEDDRFFRPCSRVIYVRTMPKDSVMKRYHQALDLFETRA